MLKKIVFRINNSRLTVIKKPFGGMYKRKPRLVQGPLLKNKKRVPFRKPASIRKGVVCIKRV